MTLISTTEYQYWPRLSPWSILVVSGEVSDMTLISTTEYQYWPRLSPWSILVFSGGYHVISDTSIVNNYIMISRLETPLVLLGPFFNSKCLDQSASSVYAVMPRNPIFFMLLLMKDMFTIGPTYQNAQLTFRWLSFRLLSFVRFPLYMIVPSLAKKRRKYIYTKMPLSQPNLRFADSHFVCCHLCASYYVWSFHLK